MARRPFITEWHGGHSLRKRKAAIHGVGNGVSAIPKNWPGAITSISIIDHSGKIVIVHRRDAEDAKEFNFLNSHER